MKIALAQRALACSTFALLSADCTFGQLLAHHEFPADYSFTTTVAVLHPGPDALLVLGQTDTPPSSLATGEVVLREWNRQGNLWSNSQAAPYRGGLHRVADLDGDGHEDILIASDKFRLFSGATSLFLGESLAGDYAVHWLGDLDGDGFDEFFAVYDSSIWTTANLQAPPIPLSLYAFPLPPSHSYGTFTDVAAIADQNGDGVREVIVGYGDCDMASHGGCVNAIIRNRAIVYSGLDGTPLMLAEGPGGHTHLSTLGKSIVELDDLDGDGKPEVLIATAFWISNPNHFYVYSGASSSASVEPLMLDTNTLFEPTSPFSLAVTWAPLLIGDVNADGFKDLALPYSRMYPSLAQTPEEYQPAARFLDGRTLDVLWDLPLEAAPSNPRVRPSGEYLAMGDVNSDAFPDFATFNSARGSVWVYSGAPPGTRVLGDGVPGTLGPTPRISVQRPPRVGENSARFNSTDVSAGATAVLLIARDYRLNPVAPGIDLLLSRRYSVASTATVAGRVQTTTTVDFSSAFQPGDRVFAQWVFFEPTPTGLHFAASPILAVAVQD